MSNDLKEKFDRLFLSGSDYFSEIKSHSKLSNIHNIGTTNYYMSHIWCPQHDDFENPLKFAHMKVNNKVWQLKESGKRKGESNGNIVADINLLSWHVISSAWLL